MEVSNSTGQNTDYRVASGGGMGVSPARPRTGSLAPGERHSVDVSQGKSWRAEFVIDDQVVASAVVNRTSARIALTQKNGTYFAEIT